MEYKNLRLTIAFKLDVHSKKQSATFNVYNGTRKLSSIIKEFIIDPSPMEIEEYINCHCIDKYEARDIWCKYMRGEDYVPEITEDYTDFLLSRIDNLERELGMYRNALGVKDGEVPWTLIDDGDELPF